VMMWSCFKIAVSRRLDDVVHIMRKHSILQARYFDTMLCQQHFDEDMSSSKRPLRKVCVFDSSVCQ